MATSNLANTVMTVSFDGGVDASGKTKILNKRFNGVKTSATDDQLYAIVLSLAPLQGYSVVNIQRDNMIDISA